MKKQTNKKSQNQTKEQAKEQHKNINELLQEFIKTNDANILLYISKVIVKKVMQNYKDKASEQAFKLYNESKRAFYINFANINCDIQDLLQESNKAIMQAIQDNEQDNIIKYAFSQVNKYLYSLRSVKISCRPFDYSLDEILEDEQFLSIRKQMLNAFKYDMLEQEQDNEQTQKQREFIYKILATLTPIQKQIVKMLAFGDSQRQIATKMNRQQATIKEHIQAIRKKANKLNEQEHFIF